MMNYQASPHSLALSMVQGVGSVLFKKLIDHYGSAEAIFATTPQNLTTLPRIGKKVAHAVTSKATLTEASQRMEAHHQRGLKLVPYGAPAYPSRLKHLPDPPPILYCSRALPLNQGRIVSIVGTRQATSYGKQQLEELIKGLRPYDVTIVSGLAHGIDIHAHRLAIKHGIRTVAVVAGGLDTLYPAEHKEDARKMHYAGGGVITEHPLGTIPEAGYFAKRNRIIAGISDVTIVVEAGNKSGSLLTAAYANEYQRAVFAFPGAIGDPHSVGCNNLIKRQQAHLLTDIQDLAEHLGWPLQQKAPARKLMLDHFTPLQKQIVEQLIGKRTPTHLTELSKQTKMASILVTTTSMELVMQNVVEALSGNRYRLCAA